MGELVVLDAFAGRPLRQRRVDEGLSRARFDEQHVPFFPAIAVTEQVLVLRDALSPGADLRAAALRVFDLRTGRPRWTVTSAGGCDLSVADLVGGRGAVVATGTCSGSVAVLALNEDDGSPRWRFERDDTPGLSVNGSGDGVLVAVRSTVTDRSAQHRGELTGVPEGELPQQDAQRGRGVDPGEDLLHPAGADDVQVVDAVRPAAIEAMIAVSFAVEFAAESAFLNCLDHVVAETIITARKALSLHIRRSPAARSRDRGSSLYTPKVPPVAATSTSHAVRLQTPPRQGTHTRRTATRAGGQDPQRPCHRRG